MEGMATTWTEMTTRFRLGCPCQGTGDIRIRTERRVVAERLTHSPHLYLYPLHSYPAFLDSFDVPMTPKCEPG